MQMRSATRSLLAHHRRGIVPIVLGVSAPIIGGCIGQSSGDWGLFERSGSITTAIGLLAASRRYVRHSIIELAALRANEGQKSDTAELLEDIFNAKIGLALAGFGTVVWGWGEYLGWWSFTYLLVWALFALRDAHRDYLHLRSSAGAAAVGETLRER
jgi:hypothetical protein